MNRCKECDNSPEFTEKVLEIVNPEQPVLFHSVTFPAHLGDDTEVLPDTLDYKNVLLTYAANKHSYLYSSDGVPVLISTGAVDIEDLERDLAALGVEVEHTNEHITTLESSITALGAKDVQFNMSVSGDASTVTIKKLTGDLAGNYPPIATNQPLPVASSTAAGIMNPATFKAVQQNSEQIDSILGGAVALENLPAEPTQEVLTAAWQTATEQTQLINRASIMDITNKKIWYFYTNVNEWYSVNNVPEVTVSVATNDSLGIVKGSETVFVEPDGSLSVVGLDGIRHDIDNILDILDTTPIPKLYNTYSSATTGANTAAFINSVLNNYYVKIGNGGSATNYAVSMGYQAQSSNYGIAIGQIAKAPINSGIAIGQKSQVYCTASSIAIGINAIAGTSTALSDRKNSSIALGYNALVGRDDELSIGNPSRSLTRYIANVTAGELPTDAVNLQQMQDYVAEHGNNPFTEMQTTRVQNLPPAVVTGFEATTYGTDAITMHLDTRDLATGGVSVQELDLKAATPNTAETGGHAGLMSAFQATQLQALAESGGIGQDTVLYEGNASVNSITLSESASNFERVVIVGKYTPSGVFSAYPLQQNFVVYPKNDASTYVKLSDSVLSSTNREDVQDIWELQNDQLDLVASMKWTTTADGATTVATETTSIITITKIIGVKTL